MNNIQKGNLGEKIATNYLISKGAYILENNYKLKFGEIDIIVKLNEELVFVEVKARSNINFGYPSEAVNYKKQMKIKSVAKYYIVKNKLEKVPIRFDVIEVYLKNNEINHIENAF
ncbi:YraN family protein [Paraclostridium benzoelyticum]|uniref:YraN family protein n=1 Tax=Paraclostridium benzoelyticum TaxID=1629550 RepID=UPI0031CCFBB3